MVRCRENQRAVLEIDPAGMGRNTLRIPCDPAKALPAVRARDCRRIAYVLGFDRSSGRQKMFFLGRFAVYAVNSTADETANLYRISIQ